jgi:hypothetical protein
MINTDSHISRHGESRVCFFVLGGCHEGIEKMDGIDDTFKILIDGLKCRNCKNTNN